jgi:hypothetical protein
MSEGINCDNCRFADLHPDNDRLLHCRRKCPSQLSNAFHAVWPVVKTDDWCGDFEEAIDD